MKKSLMIVCILSIALITGCKTDVEEHSVTFVNLTSIDYLNDLLDNYGNADKLDHINELYDTGFYDVYINADHILYIEQKLKKGLPADLNDVIYSSITVSDENIGNVAKNTVNVLEKPDEIQSLTEGKKTEKNAKLIKGRAMIILNSLPAPEPMSHVQNDEEPVQTEEGVHWRIIEAMKYELEDMTTNLQVGADGKTHYAVISASLTMNSADDDYDLLSPMVDVMKSDIKSLFITEISRRTYEEMLTIDVKEEVKQQILADIQSLFGSKFIVDITIMYLFQ